MTAEVLQGDALAVLKTLPSESVSCCVTSPPYLGLRCYGVEGQIGLESSVEEHIEKLLEVFREVRRCLHPSGTLMVNYGDAYACAPNGRSAADTRATGKDDRTFRDKPMSTVGSGYKAKDLMELPSEVARALRQDGWWLRSRLPWVKRCLSGGTVVYARTQKGEMPMTIKDLVRLRPETVQLWNGEKWTQVKGWCETPRPATTYEIELRSGERVGCTGDHRWPTQRGNVYARDLKIGDVVQTCRLPEPPDPARPMALDDALIGWFVGLYIAEGCQDGRAIHIAGHVKEEARLAKLQAIAAAYHGRCNWQRRPGNGCNISLHGPMLHAILETYVSGEGAAHKHLGPRCWERSDTFLMAVLEGYLSGDGHFDEQNQRWRLGFTRNDNLAQDLRTLCGRLGVVLRLRRCQHMLNGRKIAGFRGEIRFDVNRRQPPGGFTRKEQGEVVAIRPSRARKFWDIEVEDEPHLFALASGLLTHNSAMPESCTDRPSTALEYVFVLAKSERYFWDADAVRRPHAMSSLERERYGEADRSPGVTVPTQQRRWHAKDVSLTPNGRNLRNADFYWDSLDLAIEQARAELAQLTHLREKGGLLLSEEGEPLALDVNTEATREAHFAAFPKKLVAPLIQAGTSERGVCAGCGSPYVRVSEASYKEAGKGNNNGRYKGGDEGTGAARPYETRMLKSVQTLGWSKSCRCETEEVTPATVLDPFAGSGTTLSVALSLGRRAIGIELNESYVRMIHKRLGRTQLPLELSL